MQRQRWLQVLLNVKSVTVERDLDTVEVWGSSPTHQPMRTRCRRRVTYSASRQNVRSICALFV